MEDSPTGFPRAMQELIRLEGLAPGTDAPWLSDLAEFVQEGDWMVWRYGNLMIRAIRCYNRMIERLTFICHGDEHEALKFIGAISMIYRVFTPWDVITNVTSGTDFVVKFIYDLDMPYLFNIEWTRFGTSTEDPSVLSGAMNLLASMKVNEALS